MALAEVDGAAPDFGAYAPAEEGGRAGRRASTDSEGLPPAAPSRIENFRLRRRAARTRSTSTTTGNRRGHADVVGSRGNGLELRSGRLEARDAQ